MNIVIDGTTKQVLIKTLIEILDIDNEFYDVFDKIIEIEFGEILRKDDLKIISEYSRKNFDKIINKRVKNYIKIYEDFTENELADLIIFYKSSVGLKIKQKLSEFNNINQETLILAIGDKNLNILIDKLISDQGLYKKGGN